MSMSISIKTPEEIEKMRAAGRLAAAVLEMIEPTSKPGNHRRNRSNLPRLHHCAWGNSSSAKLSWLSEIGMHLTESCGVPWHSKREVFKDGDIMNLDVTVKLDGYHGDTSKMFVIGKPSILAERLMRVTQECLYQAIHMVKPGLRTGDFAAVIQNMPSSMVILLCVSTAAMVLAPCFMKNHKSCTMVPPVRVMFYNRACALPLNLW